MNTKIQINIATSQDISPETQMEMLSYIRSSLFNFRTNFHGANLTVIKEVSNEELMASLDEHSQDREDCESYDEAQGRHICCNPVIKSNHCKGVCVFWKHINKD